MAHAAPHQAACSNSPQAIGTRHTLATLLRPSKQCGEVAEGVDHIVWLAMLEFFQGTKAIRDGTSLETGGFPSQDVRRGIANHQGLLWSAVQRGQRGDDGIWGRL